MHNRAIARYVDGRVVKGTTCDFSPGKEVFHLRDVEAPHGTPLVTVRVKDLKLLAFVHDFAGDPRRRSRGPFRRLHHTEGNLIRVTFTDGEVLVGTSATYQPGRPGFFVEPAAENANEERIYVPAWATEDVAVL
jgi:hypothetical protein